MAEKPEELETREEKLQRAKELFGRGSRNYYVKAYAEAADDLRLVLNDVNPNTKMINLYHLFPVKLVLFSLIFMVLPLMIVVPLICCMLKV